MKSCLIFSILIFVFLALPLVNAQDKVDEVFVAYNTNANITRPCFNNGTQCSTSSICNLTVSYPTGQLMMDRSLMTNMGAVHSVTIPSPLVNQFGDHQAVMTCFDSGGDITGNGADTFRVVVTGDGNEGSVIPTPIILLMIGLVIIIVGSFKEELSMLQTMGSIMLLVVGVTTLYPGYSGLNYSNLTGQLVGISGIGVGFYFLISRSFSRDSQSDRFKQPEHPDDGRFHD